MIKFSKTINLADIAMQELGISEYVQGNNPRISEYHKYTTMKGKDESVPWCSSFINFICHIGGYERTNSARARSWENVGTEIDFKNVQRGDIVLFKRGNNPALGHVAVFLSWNAPNVSVIGGNQGNKVSIAELPIKDIVKIVRLRQITEPVEAPKKESSVPKILQSSDGTGNLSQRVKGYSLILVAGILSTAKHYGYSLTETDAQTIIENAIAIIGIVQGTYGIIKAKKNTAK